MQLSLFLMQSESLTSLFLSITVYQSQPPFVISLNSLTLVCVGRDDQDFHIFLMDGYTYDSCDWLHYVKLKFDLISQWLCEACFFYYD